MKITIANTQDFIKATRKGSRDAEIEMYGHPLNHTKVFRNKKKYTRKDKHKGSNNYCLA